MLKIIHQWFFPNPYRQSTSFCTHPWQQLIQKINTGNDTEIKAHSSTRQKDITKILFIYNPHTVISVLKLIIFDKGCKHVRWCWFCDVYYILPTFYNTNRRFAIVIIDIKVYEQKTFWSSRLIFHSPPVSLMAG